MKWINHQIVAFSMAYPATGDLVPPLIASASTTLPDIIEFGFGKIFFRKHRGLSHKPILWLIFSIFLYLSRTSWFPEIPPSLSMLFSIDPIIFTLPIISGVFIHLFADSLSSSEIPILGKRRIAMGLYKTFTFSEFIMVFWILIACTVSWGLKRWIL